jgi:hypothetical protein
MDSMTHLPDRIYRRPFSSSFLDETGRVVFMLLDEKACNYQYVGSMTDNHGELEVWKRSDLWTRLEQSVDSAG